MPQDYTKTQQLIEALKAAPMKRSAAAKLLAGHGQIDVLVKRGNIVVYSDINPDYATGRKGQRPLCQWIRIGDVEYVVGGAGRSAVKGIARAIAMLEAAGYKVIPPNDEAKRPAVAGPI